MRFTKNQKGQAAIEFLMTYGWMLLVVLIVGALIFSFVDFGTLLPNKVDLSNNLRGDPTGSIAYANSPGPDSDNVVVVFRYNGAKRATIDIASSQISTELGEICPAINITNVDTGGTSSTAGTLVPFLNGQDGTMRFDCAAGGTPVVGGLIEGDNIIGEITIPVVDPKTQLSIPSSGSVRLTISG